MKKAKNIMIQGTASSSGKSLIATALCRILRQDGFSVAPFKAQNMSNNSYVTRDGLEMGRAQAVQAHAADIEPDVLMNPILLKPTTEIGAQVVLMGKPAFIMNAEKYYLSKPKLRETVAECYDSLSESFDIIVLEGAGSPAEINLKDQDIVNMGMAATADAPVVIVGDIDRGGVFASLVGTMVLLDNEDRDRVKGFIINKFRGDLDMLKPGLEQLEKLTGKPVIGVVPWFDHHIDDEDAVTRRFQRNNDKVDIDVCVVKLPHIANFTDMTALERIPGVGIRYVDCSQDIGVPDLLIIPGTKATIADLRTLKENGIAGKILSFAETGGTVLGICGGFQMLGNTIIDKNGIESPVGRETGLGLLDMETDFTNDKLTVQTVATIIEGNSSLVKGLNETVTAGYEIHMGISMYKENSHSFTWSREGDSNLRLSGIMNDSGRVLGTYVHGILDNPRVCATIINNMRKIKGLSPIGMMGNNERDYQEMEFDRLADIIRKSIDMDVIYRLMKLEPVIRSKQNSGVD